MRCGGQGHRRCISYHHQESPERRGIHTGCWGTAWKRAQGKNGCGDSRREARGRRSALRQGTGVGGGRSAGIARCVHSCFVCVQGAAALVGGAWQGRQASGCGMEPPRRRSAPLLAAVHRLLLGICSSSEQGAASACVEPRLQQPRLRKRAARSRAGPGSSGHRRAKPAHGQPRHAQAGEPSTPVSSCSACSSVSTVE